MTPANLAKAALIGNIVLVVTGAAVRLTKSGLGCPTWPTCTEDSLVPHGEMSYHAAIEFGNRALGVLLAVLLLTLLWTIYQHRRKDLYKLAFWLFLGVPAQALLGGIVVRFELNPWLVSLHLMLSLVLIFLSVRLIYREKLGPKANFQGNKLTNLLLFVAFVVCYLGTMVTGAGPHAGDEKTVRNGLNPALITDIHAISVTALVGLTILIIWRTKGKLAAVWWLLALEFLQALVGTVQHKLGLPIWLVEIHLLGAGLIAAAAAWVWLAYSADNSGDRNPDKEHRQIQI